MEQRFPSRLRNIFWRNPKRYSSSQNRRGIGMQLLTAVRQIARNEQIKTLVHDVWHFNHEAHALYRSMGFHDTRHVTTLPLSVPDGRCSEI